MSSIILVLKFLVRRKHRVYGQNFFSETIDWGWERVWNKILLSFDFAHEISCLVVKTSVRFVVRPHDIRLEKRGKKQNKTYTLKRFVARYRHRKSNWLFAPLVEFKTGREQCECHSNSRANRFARFDTPTLTHGRSQRFDSIKRFVSINTTAAQADGVFSARFSADADLIPPHTFRCRPTFND